VEVWGLGIEADGSGGKRGKSGGILERWGFRVIGVNLKGYPPGKFLRLTRGTSENEAFILATAAKYDIA
jgi:hypothetical protein